MMRAPAWPRTPREASSRRVGSRNELGIGRAQRIPYEDSKRVHHENANDDTLARYYDRRAATYDDRDISERENDVVNLRALCENLFTGLDVLEMGCGTGIWTSELAKTAVSVTAIDISRPMLTMAIKRLVGQRNVNFIQADALKPDYLNTKFGAAFAGWLLSHIRAKSLMHFLGQLGCKVEAGGRVVLMDDTPAVNELVTRVDSSGDTYAIRNLPDGTHWRVIKNFYTKAQLEEIGRSQGADVRVHWLRYHWMMTYRVMTTIC